MTEPFSPLIPWLVWIIPIVGAMFIPALAKFGDRIRTYGAVGLAFISALLAASMLPAALAGSVVHSQVQWIPTLNITAGVLADPLRILMSNVVAWISFLIIVYSIGYMHRESNLNRYWFFMIFFIGNMQLIVLSDNFLQLFFGWEGVGLASFALIGFWNSDEKKHWVGTPGEKVAGIDQSYSPSHAGMKAFITTKVGDISFLIGLLTLFYFTGTFDFITISKDTAWAGKMVAAGLLIPVAILIFGGAIGKSAQFPLQEWLPDAMAGPTSVSALIHAATMVKAGVFLVAIIGPIFYNAAATVGHVEPLFQTIAWIGVFTAFLAATQAMVSKEVKKVLAYSTISQIGYMMLALGVAGLSTDFLSGYTAGFFHLISHAVFKASLFMGAGALIHATGSKYMSDMGGLRKEMKITFYAMLIGALSLSGIPPLSGFWSKDAVLTSVLQGGMGVMGILLFSMGLLTALITAFYSFRMLGMIFWGEKSNHLKNMEKNGGSVHEAPRIMWSTYGILAVATVGIGVTGLFFENSLREILGQYIGSTFINIHIHEVHGLNFVSLILSLVAVAVGGTLGYIFYISRRSNPDKFVQHNKLFSGLYKFLENRWYINSLYYIIFVNGMEKLGRKIFNTFETGVVEKTSDTSAELSITFSRLGGKFDVYVIDGVVNGVKSKGQRFSEVVRKVQNGVTEGYALAFSMGVLILALVMIFII